MKKIMFNDRYGLTEAILTGRKTMTRRIVKCPKHFHGANDVELEFHRKPSSNIYYDCVVVDGDGYELGQLPLPFEVGDEVAIAQSYADIYNHLLFQKGQDEALAFRAMLGAEPELHAGWENKMFVKGELMIWHIRITDLWFERLQDISDEDCLHEGIRCSEVDYGDTHIRQYTYFTEKRTIWYDTPRKAFAALIDRISGKGTWERNPYVFAYTFELIK